MRSKVGEIRGLEGRNMNQSQKTKVIFEKYYPKESNSLPYNPLQDSIVQKHLNFMKSYNTLCRQTCGGSNSYNCDFFYITLRVDNHYWKDVNEYSHMSHMECISRKFIRRLNSVLGVKREDQVGKDKLHFVGHASTFIENRNKFGNIYDYRGSKIHHHAHIVLGLYHTKSKKLNEESIRQTLDGSFVGDEFGVPMKLSSVLQSVKVQPINLGSQSKRYNELKRVIHYSTKNCRHEEFSDFTNIKIKQGNNKNDRLNRPLGRPHLRTPINRTTNIQGFQF